MKTTIDSLEGLPGADLVSQGLSDLADSKPTADVRKDLLACAGFSLSHALTVVIDRGLGGSGGSTRIAYLPPCNLLSSYEGHDLSAPPKCNVWCSTFGSAAIRLIRAIRGPSVSARGLDDTDSVFDSRFLASARQLVKMRGPLRTSIPAMFLFPRIRKEAHDER